jgi:hypothetical protein
LFGWQTFKRVGASRVINRVYKLILTLSTVIQLSLFCVVSAVSLWLDQLSHGAIGVLTTQSSVYQGFLVVVLVVGYRYRFHYPTLADLPFIVGHSLAFDGMSMFISIFVDWYQRHSQGWFAARKELKFPMVVFLVLSTLYLVGLGLMFNSSTFRWTFVMWGFFGSMVSASGLLVIIGLVVGIMCRLNFDKGLSHYRKRIAVPLV